MHPEVGLTVNGQPVRVPRGSVVAAAIVRAGVVAYRRSAGGEARAPLCGMGICFECRVTIDGVPDCLSCLRICEDRMQVETV